MEVSSGNAGKIKIVGYVKIHHKVFGLTGELESSEDYKL